MKQHILERQRVWKSTLRLVNGELSSLGLEGKIQQSPAGIMGRQLIAFITQINFVICQYVNI